MTATVTTRTPSSSFRLNRYTIRSLYSASKEGVNEKNSIIGTAAGLLQRLAQEEAWRSKNSIKASEYIVSIFSGSNLLETFVLVPGQLILDSINKRIQQTSDQEKQAWTEAGKMISDMMDRGTQLFIIDGQNRLFLAISRFLSNEFPISNDHNLILDVVKEDGSTYEFNAKGKYFKEFPVEVQDHFYNIEVPVNTASSGTLESFCSTLIWKNESIAWDDWQKTITQQWFTPFLKQIRQVSDKDHMEPHTLKCFNKLGTARYRYEVNGWDYLVAELLYLMATGRLVQSDKDLDQFFAGRQIVPKSVVSRLKSYLKDFSIAWDNKPSNITNTEIKNYVLIRNLVDRPNCSSIYNNVEIPSWTINDKISFSKECKVMLEILANNPEEYGQPPNRIQTSTAVGKTVTSKNPGSFIDLNGKNTDDSLVGRATMFFSILSGRESEKSKKTFERMMDTNVLSVKDTNAMSPLASIWSSVPFTADGEEISVIDYDDTKKFDRGHITPQSLGGSNTDLVLQKKSQNRKLKDLPIPE